MNRSRLLSLVLLAGCVVWNHLWLILHYTRWTSLSADWLEGGSIAAVLYLGLACFELSPSYRRLAWAAAAMVEAVWMSGYLLSLQESSTPGAAGVDRALLSFWGVAFALSVLGLLTDFAPRRPT